MERVQPSLPSLNRLTPTPPPPPTVSLHRPATRREERLRERKHRWTNIPAEIVKTLVEGGLEPTKRAWASFKIFPLCWESYKISEPKFLNIQWAQVSTPRNRFLQSSRYGKKGCRTGPPGWESIPGLHKRFTNSGSKGGKGGNWRKGGGEFAKVKIWEKEKRTIWCRDARVIHLIMIWLNREVGDRNMKSA